jgi:hypothetical protein
MPLFLLGVGAHIDNDDFLGHVYLMLLFVAPFLRLPVLEPEDVRGDVWQPIEYTPGFPTLLAIIITPIPMKMVPKKCQKDATVHVWFHSILTKKKLALTRLHSIFGRNG